MKLSLADRLLAAYLVLALLALIWPVYAWAGVRIEPRILGLPFSLAWVIGWVCLTPLVLVSYHAAKRRADRR